MSEKKLTEKEKQAIENASIVVDEEARNRRMIEYEVHKQTEPITIRMERVLDRLEITIPFLENFNRKHDNHTAWLIGLTAAIIVLGMVIFM